MKTVEVKLYRFSELSEEARGFALDEYRNDACGILEEGSRDAVREYYEDVLTLFGFRVDEVHWSWHIEGAYSYEAGFFTKLRREFPLDRELHVLAKRMVDLQRQHGYGVTARTACKFPGAWVVYVRGVGPMAGDVREEFADIYNGLRWWAMEAYKKAVDYQYSDEALAEDIEANECWFTEDGREWP